MMKTTALGKLLVLMFTGFVGSSAASVSYSAQDLYSDCGYAETFLAEEKKADLFASVAGGRCLSYLQGFVEGFRVSEALARRVGVEFAAFCLPEDADMSRLVRAVLTYQVLPPLPPESVASVPAGQIAIAALARAFACAAAGE